MSRNSLICYKLKLLIFNPFARSCAKNSILSAISFANLDAIRLLNGVKFSAEILKE